jgi:dTDP-4-dehydrorhamnose 3,5-epimerase-like enzyme
MHGNGFAHMTSPKVEPGSRKVPLAVPESRSANREAPLAHIPPFPDKTGQIIRMPQHTDERGTLTAIDFSSLPFVPCRAFSITDVPSGTVRGGHAHRRASQLLICLSGRVSVELRRGETRTRFDLDDPGFGLLILPGTWASQTYLQPRTTLLVFASEPYDPDDYIQNDG